jgi:hypothetical protein
MGTTLPKLHQVIRITYNNGLNIIHGGMAKGKYLGLDGIVVEFYTYFWDMIGEDFFKMISAIVKGGGLS